MSDQRMQRAVQAAPAVLLLVIGLVLPQTVSDYWLAKVSMWILLAIAALGLNLLTGFNGQISVGHFAFYGVGAYACGLFIDRADWGMGWAVIGAVVVSFAIGVVVGLPALRIKGLYLALVTLAVAVLFPELVKAFDGLTGGSSGLQLRGAPELNSRGVLVERPISLDSPSWLGLTRDQYVFYLFFAVAAICFLLVRNVVHSRIGRAMIAIRDNEVAAEVNGVHTAVVKVLTFGLSAALAGLGGALFALAEGQLFPQSFVLTFSLSLLVAVVIGGPASIVGPAIGAIFVGLFEDVVKPELPDDWAAITPLILGLSLVGLMLVAPGGLAGMARQLLARVQVSRGAGAAAAGRSPAAAGSNSSTTT